MTIHRDPHHSDFTCVSNRLIKDKRISLAAKGFMLMVLSLSDDWRFSMRGMAKFVGVSLSALYRYFDELEKNGYIHRSRTIDTKGRFGKIDLDFFEVVCSENENAEKDMCSENENAEKDMRSENENAEKDMCSENENAEKDMCSENENAEKDMCSENENAEKDMRSENENAEKDQCSQNPCMENPYTENDTQNNINQNNKNNNIISSTSSSTTTEATPPEEEGEVVEQKSSGNTADEPLLNKPPRKCYEDVCLQINAEKLRVELGREITDMAVDITFNCLKAIPVSIGGRIVDGNAVYKAFAALDEDDVRAVILAMQERGDAVRNPRSYLQTLLYNRGAELAEKYDREREEEQEKRRRWLGNIDMDEVTKDILRKYYGY